MTFLAEVCWVLMAAFGGLGMVLWLLSGGDSGIHPSA